MEEEKTAGLCPVRKKCGGCQMQNLPYADQLRWKQASVRRMLGQFGEAEPIAGMEEPYYYRNKVQTAFDTTRSGKIISGVWQAKERRVAAADGCLLEDPAAQPIVTALRKLLTGFRLQPYDARTGRGFLRYVMIRRGQATGQILVELVAAAPVFPKKNAFVKALLKACPEITTVVFSSNAGEKNLVPGKNVQILSGPGYIEDVLLGLTFRISPRSFYQVNSKQTAVLYEKALALAGLTGGEKVIDAYCGIGTISLLAAGHAAQVTGVELVGDAIRDARENARRNGIKNARFVTGDAGAIMDELAQGRQWIDVVFTDPPRAGCSRRFLESLVRLAPGRVVYISCNPETQGRDLRFLTSRGYSVKAICPVDMFPHTHHIEAVVLLSKVQK